MEIQSYNPYSFELPEEDLCKCFSYLNVEDLTTLELVSMTWNRISSDNQLWKPFAMEQGIKLTFELPFSTKVKVLLSYRLYCQAARISFEIRLNTKPINLVHEKRTIDKKISSQPCEIPFASNCPYPYLTIAESRLNNPLNINYKTPFAQVMLKARLCTANALLESAIPYLTSIAEIKQYDSFLHYLATRVEAPLATSVFPFCSAWFKLKHESDMKVSSLHIEYPEYVHTLIKKMNETEFLALLETQLDKNMQEGFKQSLLEARNLTGNSNRANRAL